MRLVRLLPSLRHLQLSPQFQWSIVILLILCLLSIRNLRLELHTASLRHHDVSNLLHNVQRTPQSDNKPEVSQMKHNIDQQDNDDDQQEEQDMYEVREDEYQEPGDDYVDQNNKNQENSIAKDKENEYNDNYEEYDEAENIPDNNGIPKFNLVLFTSFTNLTSKRKTHSTVLKNWALLGKNIMPVLFTSYPNDSLNDKAVAEGWDVVPVPKANVFGTPYIKDMFLKAKEKHEAHFYGYANGDILFSDTLDTAVDAIKFHFRKRKLNTPIFIVGRRRDYLFNNSSPEWISDPGEVHVFSQKCPVFLGGQDFFFISSKPDFPWDYIPDLVVGRLGMDSVLMSKASSEGMLQVDISRTVMALHLLGPEGIFGQLLLNYPDAKHNRQFIGDDVDSLLANTAYCKFETYTDSSGRVQVRVRPFGKRLQDLPKMLRPIFRERYFEVQAKKKAQQLARQGVDYLQPGEIEDSQKAQQLPRQGVDYDQAEEIEDSQKAQQLPRQGVDYDQAEEIEDSQKAQQLPRQGVDYDQLEEVGDGHNEQQQQEDTKDYAYE